ncbi:cyclophane-forming radical SAM peptide maturase AmcB [Streptomyces sp. H34-S4]|uniref:cyclophane-forming radical SAM peptide maturase AmcB n=1 Tax=Streptomyces sp. H34-S4 TaxID=2996463 RepID=UPI0022717E91|nr:cyclophane-forming radical SAM peptide maturase AmcB [Streptomyces sp. H34-S4]MCY0939660.1 radical SAM protein [Streptomyces sp. H34-S4]
MTWLAARPRSVIMQPGTRCLPLDCSYCYLPFRKVAHLMPVRVAEAVATVVNRWATSDPGFEVVWHGGEPLAVGREHLAALMAPFRGVKHTVQTNAVLIDDAWCKFLREHDMAVGVSIDGPEHMNIHRVTSAGHSAFRVIMRGIDRLRHHGIPFSAIAVVSDPDPALAEDFYGFFAELGVTSVGVNIEEQEGENVTLDRDAGQVTRFWEALASAWTANPVTPVREISRVLDFARSVLDDSGRVAAAAPWDPLPTVAYDGSVVLLSPELAGYHDERLGDFTTGNVLTAPLGVLLAEAEARTPWLGELWRGVEACRASCEYFAFCGGGHAANRYFEHDGRLDGTRTRYCASSKIALFEGVTDHVRSRALHR